DKEARVQAAMRAVLASGLKPGSEKRYLLSVNQAAKDFNIPPQTLRDRMNGKKTRQESHLHQLRLSEEEEQVLVNWVKEMGRRGVPMTLQTLQDHASEISGRTMGRSWADGFRSRHP
ncbi:hypothetical protein BDZ89DRAFT_885647, partial [Hymenopellis radicata]